MQRGSAKNRLLDFWLGTPLLNLLATGRRKRKVRGKPERIGVMCSPALGDTLLFSAVLQDVRAAFPSAHVVHVCMKQNLVAAEIIPGADERLLISLTSPLETVRRVRAERFDVFLDFSSWQRLTAFYVLMSRARFTVGFRSAGQYRSRGYDVAVEHRRDRHEIENFRALLRGSGLVKGTEVWHEPAVEVSADGAEPFAAEEDVVAFHPWASGQNAGLREWPAERWSALGLRLRGEGTLFVVTGGPGDKERVAEMLRALRAAGLRAEGFVSPDGFRSLTRLLRRCRVVVSVNTGVMHLAAVAGAPTVSLNGPTAEHRWGARGRCCVNVQPEDGSGGYLHLGFEFPREPEAVMERISVEQVVAACVEVERMCAPVLEATR